MHKLNKGMMEKQQINKNVTEKDLELIHKSFLELETKIKDVCKEIFLQETKNKKLFKSSHYIFSIANRTISLNRAFLTLTQVNNYNAAISLVRLQVDSCLRLFALTLVSDWRDFYDEVMKGTEIRNLRDRDGNKMTDNYLVTKYDKIYNGFKLLYKNTSGFIHFSNSHIDLNTEFESLSDKTFPTKISIGDIDKLEIHQKVDYAFNMYVVGKNIYKLIKGYQKSTNENLLK